MKLWSKQRFFFALPSDSVSLVNGLMDNSVSIQIVCQRWRPCYVTNLEILKIVGIRLAVFADYVT